ncbi:MAG: M15 family metallopeptidase [Acidobacteriota bacterium]|nr:M15 family metallopeptidase [Acidobacteriota bacterium]
MAGALFLLASLCASAQQPLEPKPLPAPAEWNNWIGEYGRDSDVLLILENHGKLTALLKSHEYDSSVLRFKRDANGRATQVSLRGAMYARRFLVAFRIEASKPLAQLKREALAATPPRESGEFRKPDLVEIARLDPSIRLDIRYATTNNFMSAAFYDAPRTFLQRPAAEALARAQRKLNALGYGLLIYDGYRPWYVTKMFWDATPEDKRVFVADPKEGSRHNRGCAVDLTLVGLKTGKPVEMTGAYDEFSDRSYADYPGGTSLQRWDRKLLRRAMQEQGFTVYEAEWWHFDYKDWKRYPILNVPPPK